MNSNMCVSRAQTKIVIDTTMFAKCELINSQTFNIPRYFLFYTPVAITFFILIYQFLRLTNWNLKFSETSMFSTFLYLLIKAPKLSEPFMTLGERECYCWRNCSKWCSRFKDEQTTSQTLNESQEKSKYSWHSFS